MSTTLPLFWHLSSASTKERLDASVKLISSLEQFQDLKAAAVAEESEGEYSQEETSADEKDRAKAKNADPNSEDVKYALRRLIRGLASPRESSRLGFSVALTELLTRLGTVDAAGVVSSILEASVTSGSMKGQEVRDTLFARLFGLTAVIQSGLLFRTTRLPSAGDSLLPVSSFTTYQTTISELLNLGDKKSWLRESAWWAIALAVKLLYTAEPEVEWKAEAISWTLDMVYCGNRAAEWTPDKLALTLCLQTLDASRPWKGLLAPTFRNASLLSSANLQAIARILKEVEDTDEPDIKHVQGGQFKVQIHSAWNVIIQSIADGKANVTFAEFYKVCVDESLFAATSSPERKSWGFQVFERALAVLPPTEFQYLFTPNFMRSWINHLASPDRTLHKAAKKAAAEIVKAVERHPSVGFSLVTHLQGTHGNQQFDRITRTKTVETILASTDVEGVKKYTTSLITQFRENHADVEPNEQDIKRQYIVEQLSGLMRNGSIPKDDEWVASILEFFTLHGMFTVIKRNKSSTLSLVHHVTKPPLSDQLRSTCRAKLLTILGDLISQAKTAKGQLGHTTRGSSTTVTGESWVAHILETIETLQQDSRHVASLREYEVGDGEVRKRAQKVLKVLQKKRGNGEDESIQGAELLVSTLLLQAYMEDESDSDVLESCLDATEKLFNIPKKGKNSPSPGEDEHAPVDLLVDAIVGMLEAGSGFSRTVATVAFGLLSGRAEGSTIDLILMQLEHRDVNDENDTEEDEEAAEALNGSAEEAEQSSSGSSEEEGMDESEESDDNAEVDPEFRRQVAEALQVNGMAPTGEEDESDSEGEVMLDDEQMTQLDEHLAKVFKSQAGGDPKQKKSAQREATHFKIRTLDLLDIFLSKQPQSPFVPRTILPLVKIILSSGPDERQLSEKTAGILRSRISKLKDVPASGFEQTSVIEDLLSIHEAARKTGLPELSACSIYLSRVLQGGEPVLEAYRTSIDDFVTRKNSKLSPTFLKDFVVRQASYAWGLRNHMIGKCNPGGAVNVYRQMQIWGLVQSLLSQIAPLVKQSPMIDGLFTFTPLIRDALYLTLRNAAQGTDQVPNAAQTKELLKIGLQAARLTRKIARVGDDPQNIWEPQRFEEVRAALADSGRFKSSPAIHALAKQFAALLASDSELQDSGKNKKRKVTDEHVGGNDNGVPVNRTNETEPRKKRKKVKKQKET